MRNYSVYVLTSPDGKRYVGMTMRKPEYRWRYGKNYEDNRRLAEALRCFGWENFKKEIVAENLTKEEACARERSLIEEYQTQDPRYGYNIEMGGVPEHLAEQTKAKMSEAHKGQVRDEIYRKHISESKKGEKNGMYGKLGELNPKARTVEAYDFAGNLLFIFPAISEACRALNLSKNAFKNISACCMGKRRSAYGYVWRYRDGNTH